MRFNTNKVWSQVNPLWLSVTHRVASSNHSFYKSPQAVVIIEFMETYLKVMGMKI